MELLLRQVRRAADGAIEYQDTELTADSVSVGSAARCTIQLLGKAVSPSHATIRGGAGGLSVVCRSGRTVNFKDKAQASVTLGIGDEIEIGGHRLRRVDPPAGFDAALEIEANTEVAASDYEQAFRTDLSATWLSKRGASWTLAAVILILSLLIPYGSIAPQRTGAPAPALLPSDQFWSAGPLIPAHQLAAGQRCANCHQQIFIHVRDAACRECHKSIADHVETSRLEQTHLGAAQRCAQCHREHNAPPTGLVIRDDQLCIDCHVNSASTFGTLRVRAVSGFSRTAHPAFTVSLLKPGSALNSTGLLDWVVHREPVATATEQSNLKFSHEQHLDPTRVRRASDSGALGCSDCHKPAADGEHFIPITMQRSCSSCHELTFDPAAPDRQLPHGKPRDAILLIQDYFARKAVDPNPAASTLQRRRLPDQQVEETPCAGPLFSCAMRRATAEIDNQFTTRGCASCHNVSDNHGNDLLERYQVAPVRLTRDYFPSVSFSHRLHAVQKDKSGDEACLSCHPVQKSTSSKNVVIPDLPKCLECHSERPAVDRVALQCSSCHAYHPKTNDRIREGDVL